MRLSLVSVATLLAAHAVAASPVGATTCSSPSVRYEWRALGEDGQKAFADAVKCLAQLPHNASLEPTRLTAGIPAPNFDSSRYDDVVYAHMDVEATVHYTGRFFPWHRLYLHTMETILRSECGYTGTIPYWDWTLDSNDIKHSPIFNCDPETGFGVFPEAEDGYNLTTGAFANTTRVYPTPHYIQRNYNLKLWAHNSSFFPLPFLLPEKNTNDTQTKAMQDKMVNSFVGNISGFQAAIDGIRLQGLHGAAHGSVGGDLANLSYSPNDPLFWLLHGMLDRIWALWQAADPANFDSVGGGEVQDLAVYDTFPTGKAPWVNKTTLLQLANLGGPDMEGKTIGDVFDTQGGLLCYVYV